MVGHVHRNDSVEVRGQLFYPLPESVPSFDCGIQGLTSGCPAFEESAFMH